MGKTQKWFIGRMDAHTNECVYRELAMRPAMNWTERYMPVHGFKSKQPVIEFDSYEFIGWLKLHQEDLALNFRTFQQQFPDTPLVEFKLGQKKPGGRKAAEARMKQRQVHTAP